MSNWAFERLYHTIINAKNSTKRSHSTGFSVSRCCMTGGISIGRLMWGRCSEWIAAKEKAC